jgi:hypothetical protein
MSGSYKVGDELAIRCGTMMRSLFIYKISKITASGRIVCGPYTLNPDLTVRGHQHTSISAEPVTDEIRDEIQHKILWGQVLSIRREDWQRFSLEQLQTVLNILEQVKDDDAS